MQMLAKEKPVEQEANEEYGVEEEYEEGEYAFEEETGPVEQQQDETENYIGEENPRDFEAVDEEGFEIEREGETGAFQQRQVEAAEGKQIEEESQGNQLQVEQSETFLEEAINHEKEAFNEIQEGSTKAQEIQEAIEAEAQEKSRAVQLSKGAEAQIVGILDELDMDIQFNESEMIFEEEEQSNEKQNAPQKQGSISMEMKDKFTDLASLREGLAGKSKEPTEGFAIDQLGAEDEVDSVVDFDNIDEELLSRDFSAQAAALKQQSEVVLAADPVFAFNPLYSEQAFSPENGFRAESGFRSKNYYESYQDWHEAEANKDAEAFNARIFREEGFDNSEAAFQMGSQGSASCSWEPEKRRFYLKKQFARVGFYDRSEESEEEQESFRPSADLMSYRSEFRNDLLGTSFNKAKEKVYKRPKWQTRSPVGLREIIFDANTIKEKFGESESVFQTCYDYNPGSQDTDSTSEADKIRKKYERIFGVLGQSNLKKRTSSSSDEESSFKKKINIGKLLKLARIHQPKEEKVEKVVKVEPKLEEKEIIESSFEEEIE